MKSCPEMRSSACRKNKKTVTLRDTRFPDDEERFSTIGLLDGAVVAIAHTETSDDIRVISMRKAERHEREQYFARLQKRGF